MSINGGVAGGGCSVAVAVGAAVLVGSGVVDGPHACSIAQEIITAQGIMIFFMGFPSLTNSNRVAPRIDDHLPYFLARLNSC
jgi:hypothetical protein